MTNQNSPNQQKYPIVIFPYPLFPHKYQESFFKRKISTIEIPVKTGKDTCLLLSSTMYTITYVDQFFFKANNKGTRGITMNSFAVSLLLISNRYVSHELNRR